MLLVQRFIKVSAYVIVIAGDSEAILSLLRTRDCFVAFTPRNDNFYVYILLKRYTRLQWIDMLIRLTPVRVNSYSRCAHRKSPQVMLKTP